MRQNSLIVALTLLSLLLSACGRDAQAKRAYERCMARAEREAQSKEARVHADIAQSPASSRELAERVGKDMGAAAGKFQRSAGTSMCESLKRQCDQDPNGLFCQTFIKNSQSW